MVRPIRLSIERSLVNTAADLGARPLLVLIAVTPPQSLPILLVGAILGFAKAVGEFGATIARVSHIPRETKTFPSAIYASRQVVEGEIAALRLMAVAVIVSASPWRCPRRWVGPSHDASHVRL